MEVIPRKERIKDGEPILQEGAWPYYVYILKSGKAKVFKNRNNNPVLIGTLNPGDTFGEIALLGRVDRTASVIADGDVEVEMIPVGTFFDALNQLPHGVLAKVNALVSDLTSMDEVRSRLIALLVELQNARSRMIDQKSFEREIENMPEPLRRLVMSLVQRLNASVQGCAKLAVQAEETVRVIDSPSTAGG